MPADRVDESPPLGNGLGVLEVDAFCAQCHYNLHGQVVTLDERLRIPVCRCPECGRFHPAGSGVTSNSIWLRRLATLLLFLWIGAAAGITIAWLFALAGVGAASVGQFLELQTVGPNGEALVEKMVNGTSAWTFVSNGAVCTNLRNVYTIDPFWTLHDSDGGLDIVAPVLVVLSGTLGFLAGALCVTLLWHWPRRRYFWCLLLPCVPSIVLIFAFLQDKQYEFIRGGVIGRVLAQAVLQCLGILVGILLGRTVSRALIRMLVPPKTRQLLAFLWQIDGKTMPAGVPVEPGSAANRR